jgi:hypothetical protein
MFRFLFRFFGLIFLAAAFILVIYDGTRSIAGNAFAFTNVRDLWATIHSASLAAAQPAVERSVPWLWETVLVPVLIAPSWLFLGVLGIVLILVGRKKKPLIGYAR